MESLGNGNPIQSRPQARQRLANNAGNGPTASAANPVKVLISAFACHPRQGSEEGNGWNWALQAARYHRTWLITAFDPDNILAEDEPDDKDFDLTIVRCRVPFWPDNWQETRRYLRVHYLLWQIAALVTATRLHRRIQFDVIHHVTYNSIDFPGLLWLIGPVFIWGPIGGAQEPSPHLRRYFGPGWCREVIRIARKRLVRLSPFTRLPLRRAPIVLAANQETYDRLVSLGARQVIRQTDVGIRSLEPGQRVAAPVADRNAVSGPLKVLWMGYFLRRKGAHLALDVIAEVKRHGQPIHLTIVGDGPLRPRIEARIEELGLAKNVCLAGRIRPFPEDADRVYNSADVFLFTSLHDTSGQVLLEAMEYGLPIVALDQHGTRDIVTEDTGFKIPILSAEQVVADMARSLIQLARDPALRIRMGANARTQVIERFSWQQRGELLREVYANALASTASRRSTAKRIHA